MENVLHLCIVLSAVVESFNLNCSHEEVRLRGGTEFAGRVEVCANGTWGTICDRGWDHHDAGTVCNQLNLSYSVSAACGSACFGEGEGAVHYKDVDCPMDAQSLANCTLDTVGSGACSNHTNDAGVICMLTNSTILMEESDEGDGDDDSTVTTQVLGTIVGILLLLLAGVITGWVVTCYKYMSKNTMQEETSVHYTNNSHNEYSGLQFPNKNTSTTSNPVLDFNYDTVEVQVTAATATNPAMEYDVLRSDSNSYI